MCDNNPFDDKYWNLAQATAWVEYRERQLVNDFNMADVNDYIALEIYTEMWPDGRKKYGDIRELHRVLEHGRIISSGYRHNDPARLVEIPAAEWTHFAIRPPFVCFAGEPEKQPWNKVRLPSADIKKLWRSIDEVSGRSRFDWAAIRTIYEEHRERYPHFSQNELIHETQCSFQERFKNKSPPGRSTIQRKIKDWS